MCLFPDRSLVGQPLGIYNQPLDETDLSTDNAVEKNPVSDDNFPPEIQNLSSLPGISKMQLIQILTSIQQQENNRSNRSKKIEDDFVSIFTIVKLLILSGLLSYLVWIFNRDYNNIVTIWFVRTFPRESSTLGLLLHDEL